MDKSEVLHLLGWCSLIYLSILVLISILSLFARKWLYSLHSKWFALSEEHFNSINYALLGWFKLMLIMFFLVPYLVLRGI